MIRALRTAASGMTAQQLNVDNIANNLANVNTTGFKKSKVEFQDIMYQTLRKSGVQAAIGAVTPTALDIGYGAKPIATTREYSVGTLQQTGNALDIAIDGDGFLQVQQPDGSTAYTRDGSIKMTAEGRLATSDGFIITPEISIPEDSTSISIGFDGVVSVVQPGSNDATEVGQIELARFINPAGLSAMGHNLFKETPASGTPITGVPSEAGIGTINQGYLEMSNVDVVTEMVNMIVAQRAYEINSKAIQTADDMTSLVNNLKR
jgi:flagellar basal-body rod protein FlgG